MKYRNDFVTNSSSSITVWSEHTLGFKLPKNAKLKYDKKIKIYSGWPVDLKVEEFDLQSLLQDKNLPLVDFRYADGTMSNPCTLERLMLSDLFLEYLEENNFDERFYIKKCNKTGKLFLSAQLRDLFKNKICNFDFDPYIDDDPSFSFNQAWDSFLPPDDTKIDDWFYAYPKNAAERSKFLAFDRYKFVDGEFTDKIDKWDFESFIYSCDKFLSDYIDCGYKAKSFVLWFASKYLIDNINGKLIMQSDCLLPPSSGLIENHPDEFAHYEECISKKVKREV